MTSHKKQTLFISKRVELLKYAIFSVHATGFAGLRRQKSVEIYNPVCYNVENETQGSYIGNTTASQAVKAGSIPVPCSKSQLHSFYCGAVHLYILLKLYVFS